MGTNPNSIAFKINGLDCAEEVAILKREIGPLVGGSDQLAFDVLNGRMSVLSGPVNVPAIVAAVQRTGMSASVEAAAAIPPNPWRLRLTVASGAFIVVAFLLQIALPIGSRLLYVAAILSGLVFVLPKAWFSLRRARPDMNLLMVIAVCGAIAIGEWFEGATVAFLFALSLTLESWSIARARHAISTLLDLSPRTVRVVSPDGTILEQLADTVPIGTRFSVRPGERIPLDGDIVSGISEVNQAPITGESVAVTKEPGAAVFAGTVNGAGALEAVSTKGSSDTALANIIRLIGEAQRKRAPSERWVDHFARYYTPIVMLLSLLVMLVPTLAFGQPFQFWFYQALVLLVIACPCALVVSTPVSVVAAVAAAARHGVLVKGGLYLETAAALKAIAIDKTGTLTTGRPAVTSVVALEGHDEKELLERAMALEGHSDHPLAAAIMEYGTAKGIRPIPAEQFTIIPGKGATGVWNNDRYWLGSHRFLEERDQETPEVHQELERLAATGKTVVVIGNNRHVCGFFSLADEVRPEAAAVVADLRQSGIEHIVMLTGDNHGTAEAIAKSAGITEIQSELLPEDKVRTVETLVHEYKSVAMIGDGINDAPALTRASVGIAMGAAGSDTATEAADIALMSGDLTKIAWLIRHAKRMLSIIRANIVLSLSVKAIFTVLTFLGHSSLWGAIAADMGITLIVIFNALRLLTPAKAR